MAVNVVALAGALNQIESRPEAWNQKSWCGCFAAHVVRAEGYQITGETHVLDRSGKDIGFVWGVASEILFGPGSYFANNAALNLFDSDNSLDRIRSLVTGFINTAVESELLEADRAEVSA